MVGGASDDKKRARLNCISHLLSSVEYQEIEHAPISLPEINKQGYVRPPIETKPLFHSATNPLPTNSVNLLLNGKLADSAAYKLGFFSTSSILDRQDGAHPYLSQSR